MSNPNPDEFILRKVGQAMAEAVTNGRFASVDFEAQVGGGESGLPETRIRVTIAARVRK